MSLRRWLSSPLSISMWISLGVLHASPGCGGERGSAASGQAGAAVGTPAPTVTGKSLAGEYVSLADYRGKVVLLNVWATWCAPCRKELPELVALHDRYGKDGFVVLGVSVDQPGARGQVERLVKQFGLTYPILLDPGGSGLDALAIRGYPTSFLVGRDGTLRWRRDGLVEPGEGELGGQIKAALAEG